MSFDFEGKVAIVTGAGGGLGFAYAKYLAERGCNVIVNDLGGGTFGVDGKPNSQVAEEAVVAINALGKGKAVADGHNVADYASAQAMVKTAIATWNRIDIIINNAGIASTSVFPNVDKEEVELHLGVHVMGAINTMRAAWPHMIEQNYGRIINTASDSLLGFSPQISYPAMKSALIGLTRNVGLLGQGHNININVILPAAFTRLSAMLPASDFRDHLEQDFQPDKLAPAIAYLCHEQCDVSREIFSVGGGKIARVVLASSQAIDIDMSMESASQQIDNLMTDDTSNLFLLKSTFDDLGNLGFSKEEYELFYDMTATQDQLDDIEAISIDTIDNVWDITVKSPVGDQFSRLVLKAHGGQLKGHVLNEEHGDQIVLDGRIESGEYMVWKCKITKPVPLTLSYTLQMDKHKNIQGQLVGSLMGKTVMDCAVIGKPVLGVIAEQAKLQRAKQAEIDDQKKPGILSKLFSKV